MDLPHAAILLPFNAFADFSISSIVTVKDDLVVDSVNWLVPFEVRTKYLKKCSRINIE
jgi:hypothetical protein